MSRYIDADAVKEALKQNTPQYMWGEVLTTVNVQPYIDIVKCVDCRKCKEQGGHANCGGYLYCTKQKTMVDEDCFCSWGERREP